MWNYRQSPFDNDWLAHFGILGQRWGVRRFQNEDGSLTEEGKLRYSETVRDQSNKSTKIEKQFKKANDACLRDQDVIRNWKPNYESYKNKEKDLVSDYRDRYMNDLKIKDIDRQREQLVKDYFQAKEQTKITIGDILFRRKEVEEKRDALLNGLKKVYKDLNTRRDEECYRIAYDVFKDLPKYEKIIAMGVFQPNEGEWKKVRKQNTLV